MTGTALIAIPRPTSLPRNVKVAGLKATCNGADKLLTTTKNLSKICPKCGIEKKIPEDFGYRTYGNQNDGLYLHSYCYECQKALSRAYRKTELGKQTSRRTARGGGRYAIARRDARSKNVSFTLSRDEYLDLRSKACHYCDGPLPETGLGLDRIDGKKGYELGNIFPCCRWCNSVRNCIFTVEEMEQVIGPAIKKIRLARAAQDMQR